MNRNPYKRLGSGKRDAEEIKEHPFFAQINWNEALQRKLKVPKMALKKVAKVEVPLDKVYGKGAFDDSQKNLNRLNEWSFI